MSTQRDVEPSTNESHSGRTRPISKGRMRPPRGSVTTESGPGGVGGRISSIAHHGDPRKERRWTGSVPRGMTRIEVPHRSALVIGRVFAADDDDRLVAYALAKQTALTAVAS
jgi:hypothetical protein